VHRLSGFFLSASEKQQFPKYTCSFTLNLRESVLNDHRFDILFKKQNHLNNSYEKSRHSIAVTHIRSNFFLLTGCSKPNLRSNELPAKKQKAEESWLDFDCRGAASLIISIVIPQGVST
jgi:hypothetical protein